jgi:hypothetical protein
MDQAEQSPTPPTENPGTSVAAKSSEPPQAHHKEPSQHEVAKMIADQLEETDEKAVAQIHHLVWRLGRTQSLTLLAETLQIEERGGMMLPDGSRRRTAGGVFFLLAKTKGQKKERPWKGMPKPAKPQENNAEKHEQKAQAAKPPVTPPAFTWEDRLSVVQTITAEKGTARTVKITLIGRPGKMVDKGSCIVTIMQENKVPALPKGLPVPQAVTTNYVVYIAAKQWKNVSEALNDPDDILIIEGFPQLDAKNNSIAVFATNTTTKKLQAGRRQPPATSQPT